MSAFYLNKVKDDNGFHIVHKDGCDLMPEPEELVYLYRTRAGPEAARRLFLEYVDRINQLKAQPEFYNTLTTNCTTDVWSLVRALSDQFPLDRRVLLSGYFPEYLYDLGSLDSRLPFPALKAQSLINDRAHAADQDPAFSRRIREALPRPPSRSASEALPGSQPDRARTGSGRSWNLPPPGGR